VDSHRRRFTFFAQTKPADKRCHPGPEGIWQLLKRIGMAGMAFKRGCSWRTNLENILAKSSRDSYLMANLDQL
jgi:hypothetical protein